MVTYDKNSENSTKGPSFLNPLTREKRKLICRNKFVVGCGLACNMIYFFRRCAQLYGIMLRRPASFHRSMEPDKINLCTTVHQLYYPLHQARDVALPLTYVSMIKNVDAFLHLALQSDTLDYLCYRNTSQSRCTVFRMRSTYGSDLTPA